MVNGCHKLEIGKHHWLLQAWVQIPIVLIFTDYPLRQTFKVMRFFNYHEP